MASMVLKCPQCGGPFECDEGARTAVCGFCGVTSVLSGNTGVNRLMIRERIDLNAARTAVRKLLAANVDGEESSVPYRYESARLLFLPFWRMSGMAIGWQWCEKETFTEEVDYDENGTRYTRTVKGVNERIFSLIAKPLYLNTPAGDYSVFGQLRVGLAATVLKCEALDYPDTAARATVVDPLKGVSQARQEALAITRGGTDSGESVRREVRINIASEWLALTYYPLWQLLFTSGDRVYPVTVDAVSGDVVTCRFPGEERRKRFLPLALVALLVLGWTTMPLVGVGATILAVYLLKWQAGTLNISSIIKLLAGTSERSGGRQRG